jgi:hypothetical protein
LSLIWVQELSGWLLGTRFVEQIHISIWKWLLSLVLSFSEKGSGAPRACHQRLLGPKRLLFWSRGASEKYPWKVIINVVNFNIIHPNERMFALQMEVLAI